MAFLNHVRERSRRADKAISIDKIVNCQTELMTLAGKNRILNVFSNHKLLFSREKFKYYIYFLVEQFGSYYRNRYIIFIVELHLLLQKRKSVKLEIFLWILIPPVATDITQNRCRWISVKYTYRYTYILFIVSIYFCVAWTPVRPLFSLKFTSHDTFCLVWQNMVAIPDVDRGYAWVILGGNTVLFSPLFDYLYIKNDIPITITHQHTYVSFSLCVFSHVLHTGILV